MAHTQILKKDNLRINVLVVDDESSIRMLLNRILASKFNVHLAASAEEALLLLRKNRYDLAIVDVNMPGKSGKELLSICRKDYPNTHIILMTGMPELADAVDTVKEGAFYYLPKPIDFKFLFSLMDRAIEEREKKIESGDIGRFRNLASKYKIIRSLGCGISGIVLLAEKDGRQYAMKVLRWSGESDNTPEKLERFAREAEILMRINNKHVVKIFEHNLNRPDENPYIIMEYVKGMSLTQCLEKKMFNINQKISIIEQIAEGIECVHESGVLHRDIKPENIIIADDLTAKITDFGVSHVSDSCLTMDDEILGSPSYMSPESFDEIRKMDERSDIFSIGVLSYEMLTGFMPFEGESIYQVMEAIRKKNPVAPMKRAPQLPSWMQDVMVKMLDKNPDGRYRSAGEIVKAIRLGLSEGDGTSPSITSRILRSRLFLKNIWS
ncbi:MAG: protein kinase [Victivallales bacterium]